MPLAVAGPFRPRVAPGWGQRGVWPPARVAGAGRAPRHPLPASPRLPKVPFLLLIIEVMSEVR